MRNSLSYQDGVCRTTCHCMGAGECWHGDVTRENVLTLPFAWGCHRMGKTTPTSKIPGWTSESCLCEPFDLPLAVQGTCLTRNDQACVKCHQSHRNHTTQYQLLSLWAFLTLSAMISFPDKTGPPDTWDVLVITVHQHFSHRPTQSECTPRCHRGKNQFDHRQQGGKSGLDILIL